MYECLYVSFHKKDQHSTTVFFFFFSVVYMLFLFLLLLLFCFYSIEKFCAEGIPLLGVLVQSRYLRTVVHVLDKVLPIFYSCQYYLLKSEQ